MRRQKQTAIVVLRMRYHQIQMMRMPILIRLMSHTIENGVTFAVQRKKHAKHAKQMSKHNMSESVCADK